MMKIADVAFRNLDALNSKDRRRLEDTRNSSTTIVVPDYAPAIEVAVIADFIGSCQILLTNAAGEIDGLLMPCSVRDRIGDYRNRSFESLRESLEDLLHDSDEASRSYHHEWLNDDRPDMVWCDKGGHLSHSNPCERHV